MRNREEFVTLMNGGSARNPPRFTDGKKDALGGIIVALVALLVYANSVGNGFVWDDELVIVTNPVLRGEPLDLFRSIDTGRDTDLSPFYRPLTYLSFLVEHRVHTLAPFPMHAINVVLHAANAFLVFLLARTLMRDRSAALVAGLLFAVHPIHAEGVNFLSGGRNTLLACLFVLGAYLLHRESVLRGRYAIAIAAALSFFAALLSKETAAAALPVIVTLEYASLRDNVAGARSRVVLRLLPHAAAATAYLTMRWMALSVPGVQTSFVPGFGSAALQAMYVVPSFGDRLFNIVYSVPRYLLATAWPEALSPRYEVPLDLRDLTVPLSLAWLGIAVLLAAFLMWRRSRPTLFGLFWLVMFWLPVSGIIFFPGAPLADRYFYLPAIGLWLVVADQVGSLLPSRIGARRTVLAAAVLVLLVLSGMTIRRNLDWRSDMTLFSRLVEQYPENAYGHANLGNALLRRGQPGDSQQAERELRTALDLDPAMRHLLVPLGHTRLLAGDNAGALEYYSEALKYAPDEGEALINRGFALDRLGRREEAMEDYRRFLSLADRDRMPGWREYAERRLRELQAPQVER
jgi:tetratricopeptide (TPR) repeat protein